MRADRGAAGGPSACSVYSYAPSAPEEEVFEEGTYNVTVLGHNGDVRIAVTFDKYRVTKIEVLEHQESPGLGDTAMQEVADAIINKQSFEVDTVSGATYSSVAVLQAVSLAAKAAGAENVPDISVDALYGQGEEDDEPVKEGGYVPGTYTATADGYHGEVTVTVTVDEENIVSVTAEGPGETEGIGTRALEQLPGRIVEANSANVDTVSGATMTSNAIKRAVKDALKQAQNPG